MPPNGNESITATLHPAELHFSAVVDAAVPDPITIRSNDRALLLFPSIKPLLASQENTWA